MFTSSSTLRHALHSSLALALGALALAPAANAQEAKQASGAPAETDVTEQDDIVVTGQALPGAVIGDIPPENRLTPADIAAYGVDSVSDLLDQISDQTSSIQGRGSSGPVVLVNGKRISGINEVGDLPTESILRLDILPEEVALKYGYSATQKVVNIILRRRFRAHVAGAGTGAATDGGGGNVNGDFGITRIHDNERLNVVARAKTSAALLESQRGIVADPAAGDPANALASDPDYRTLNPSTRNYSVNGTYAYQISPKLTASLNATAGYQTSRGLAGAAPLSGALDPDEIAALRQDSDTFTAHGGVTLNYDLSTSWKLSFTGTYDHSDMRGDTDRFQSAAIRDQHTTAISNSAGASVLVSGPLFSLPAGKLRTSLQFGGNASQLSSTTDRLGGGTTMSNAVTRSTGNAQLSFDVPITSAKTGFGGAIGTLTANVNGEINQLSDYGTLGTFGYGLNWTPRTGITVIASVIGGMLGYAIGHFLFASVGEQLLSALHLTQSFPSVACKLRGEAGFLAIIAKGITPIPFKLVTIATGVVHLNLVTFVIASLATRGLRFVIVAWLFYRFTADLREAAEDDDLLELAQMEARSMAD